MFSMKKLLLSCLLFFSLVLTSHASRDFKLDEQATADAPWKVDAEVARVDYSMGCHQNIKWEPPCSIYRKFLGVGEQGYYLVQDFYEIGKTNEPHSQTPSTDSKLKYSNPYWVISEEGVVDTYIWVDPFDFQRAHVDGLLIFWHTNGSKFFEILYHKGVILEYAKMWGEEGVKRMEIIYEDDKIHGVMRVWRDDGSKEGEIAMKGLPIVGVKHGSSIRWHENGQKQEEGSYYEGKKVGVWRTWDEQGKLQEEVNCDEKECPS